MKAILKRISIRIRAFYCLIFTKKVDNQIKIHRQKLFLSCLREFLDARIIEENLSGSTKTKYDRFYGNIASFLNSKQLLCIEVTDMNPAICEELRLWLHKNLKQCGKSHSSRHLEKCKAAMDYAVTCGWMKYNPLTSLKTGRDRKKAIIYFTAEELWKWINYKFENEIFRKVQLLSIFQAATGLSYGNLFDYKTRLDPDTGLWIEDNRKKKGKKPFYVPLDAPEFELAKTIHLQLDGELPYIDNGTYNRMLKEMCAIVGIKKRPSTHSFRKTFATMMDQEDFSLGVISAILGNTEEVCRENYINATKKKIEKAFNLEKQNKSENVQTYRRKAA